MSNWFTKSIDEVFNILNTGKEGLSDTDASDRISKYGPNSLNETSRKSPLKMLFRQFTETMVIILIIAAILSAILGKTTEAIAILSIVLLFGFLGFFQEYRAEKAMAALNRMVVPVVRVRRNGIVKEISAKDLVPGDIVEFESGNLIPADLRILESFNLKIQESALTGESESVDKICGKLEKPDLPLGDRINMAYMGTIVTYGRGLGICIGTGMDTELGKIAGMIDTVESKRTPLQDRLDKLGKILAGVGVVAAALIFAVGIFMGETLSNMFLTAVSVAVAVVPEGLPAVVTITLALGGQRMLKRNALIRKLPAVETLGSVTVICSDKTGTLTQNNMQVTIMDLPDKKVEIPEENITGEDDKFKGLDFALTISALCNDAVLESEASKEGKLKSFGDPTEIALLVCATKRGIFKNELSEIFPREEEIPFDSDRKRMSTLHRIQGDLPEYVKFLNGKEQVLFTKGAADELISVCRYVWVNNQKHELDDEWKKRILKANTGFAENGLRVLGLAFHTSEDTEEVAAEDNLIFVGLACMIDPPRLEVKDSVENCRKAGIKPVMITGDHPLTANTIGKGLNFPENQVAITGDMLDSMDDNKLMAIAEKASIYARVSPEDKLRIVDILQKRGEVVAMTGDGVNDSPALKKANIGVAMGITGTDVAKESADMVLLDDNFATIVAAVEEGRVIFDNLVRFIKFSLAGNTAKVLIMLLGPFFGMVIALRPLQLLWLNLLTDGLLGLGLGTEPAEEDTMQRPPRNPAKGALDRADYIQIAIVGIVIAIISLGLGIYYYNPTDESDLTWQTMIFATIGFAQVFQALALRSSAHSPFSVLINPLMTVVILLTLGLQFAVLYIPVLTKLFGLVHLSLENLLISIAASSIIFIVIKLDKWIFKR